MGRYKQQSYQENKKAVWRSKQFYQRLIFFRKQMNNYKFRIWSKPDNKFVSINSDSYQLVYQGDIWLLCDFCKTDNALIRQHVIDGENYVMQISSCVADKNGKEVFNGDIVKFQTYNYHSEEREEYSGPVTFDNGIFLFGKQEFATNDSNFMVNTLEVIGNVFENPEII